MVLLSGAFLMEFPNDSTLTDELLEDMRACASVIDRVRSQVAIGKAEVSLVQHGELQSVESALDEICAMITCRYMHLESVRLLRDWSCDTDKTSIKAKVQEMKNAVESAKSQVAHANETA